MHRRPNVTQYDRPRLAQSTRAALTASGAVTMLGTGTPQPNADRRGSSQVVEAGGDLVLVDCGPGALHRFLEAGYRTTDLTHILLTHLHSDHTTGLADLLWAGWIGGWRAEPPTLVGPAGTRRLLEHVLLAYEDDIRWRTEEGAMTRAMLEPGVEEIEDGWSFEGGGWRVEAFAVDHRPIENAFGFRFDLAAGSIVLSGDTCACESVVEHAAGADILVHEAISESGMRRAIAAAPTPAARRRLEGILGYHTPATTVGEIAAAAGVGRVVLTHLVLAGSSPDELRAEVRRSFRGPVTVADDLSRFALEERP